MIELVDAEDVEAIPPARYSISYISKSSHCTSMHAPLGPESDCRRSAASPQCAVATTGPEAPRLNEAPRWMLSWLFGEYWPEDRIGLILKAKFQVSAARCRWERDNHHRPSGSKAKQGTKMDACWLSGKYRPEDRWLA
jgi:hypothetical protein